MLQTLHGFLMSLLDFGADAVHFVGRQCGASGGMRPVRDGKRSGTGNGALQKSSPVG